LLVSADEVFAMRRFYCCGKANVERAVPEEDQDSAGESYVRKNLLIYQISQNLFAKYKF